ncbi:MAG: IcmL protein [Marinobacter sp. T13-3]|nr:MAG: IcmL protein [Marinobacter sp. T13-3]
MTTHPQQRNAVQKGTKGSGKRPQAQGKPRPSKAPPRKTGKKSAPPTKGKPTGLEEVPVYHGAEALAALTVAESKHSRFKGRVVLGLTLALAASLGWNSVQTATRPEPKLLATTVDGRIQELPLLDAPIESRQVLLDWVRRNIPDLYDFNYVNFRAQFNQALDFTRRATMEAFYQDLNDSGILPKVRKEFLILRANIVQDPVITNEKIIQGRRVWIVEVPMNLVYDSGDVQNGKRQRITQPILFTAWVARANPLEFDGGLMLAKYSISNRREE